jgi:hypothetical protein
MIEDIILFIGFYIASITFIRFVMSRKLGPYKTPLFILGFIGVFIHELSHLLMNFLCNVPTSHFRVKYRDEYQRANPHGSVGFKERTRLTFLQAVVVGLAPLYICTWLCLFFLGLMLEPVLKPLFRIISALLFLSIFIGAAPSNTDLRNILSAFKQNRHYSFRQTVLLIVGIGLYIYFQNQLIVFLPEFISALPFIPFLYIMLLYYIVKYISIALYSMFKKISRSRPRGPKDLIINARSSVDARIPKAFRFTKHDEDGIW